MKIDKGIVIKNIYYMLSYAFRSLKQEDYEKVAAEEFDKIEDLFAAILLRGVSVQLKRGLYHEYVQINDSMTLMRGKLNISETIVLKGRKSLKISCGFDEFSENNIYNQILKTTMKILVRAENVEEERKNELKKLLLFFDGVDIIQTSHIQWNKLIYRRNNRNYELLLNVCYLLLTGMLQTTENGAYKLISFSDEHMEKLFERFVLEYYRQHHSELNPKSCEVKWDISEEDYNKKMIVYMPKMQTDIMLQKGSKTLIIDAKYYKQSLNENYHKSTFYSAHLYQIFAYVKNMDKDNTGNVAGLLLYAKTENDILTNFEPIRIAGNSIGVRTLDLNRDFSELAEQLNSIVDNYFI